MRLGVMSFMGGFDELLASVQPVSVLLVEYSDMAVLTLC